MEYLDILRKYWGYDDFRGIQKEIIESIGQGHDTLGLMPTGGGKSITFQVPALAKEGVCIIITPLIALMKDQVTHLREKGILASAVYSGMTHDQILTTLDNAVLGGVKLLYVSPERLASKLFLTKLCHLNVSFITVDEAHCISQWGYDFRPSYLAISEVRKVKPDVPILALTATATPEVVEDIQRRLGFPEPNVFSMSFERKNLAYVVRKAHDKIGEMVHILKSVPGSSIVYVRSRKRAKEMAAMINKEGISATFYHAGLEPLVKDMRQHDWQGDRVRVMVATNAFGMGIDKPDVRTVIHIDCPDSIEAYFQEAGRAGRDGRKSYAVLLYNNSDSQKLKRRVSDNYPDREYIRNVYDSLAYYYQMAEGDGYGVTHEFDIDKFCRTYRYFPVPADAALRILDRAGYIAYDTDPRAAARVMFRLERHELYRLHNCSPREEAVITSLLRNYGGLFSDYCFIDENLIAMDCKLTIDDVYIVLKTLRERNILDFIPRRKMPYITYIQRREAHDRVVLPKEVYEDRKEQYSRRIELMLRYAQDDSRCRSRQLLEYFGEKRTDDCRQCDVCIGKRGTPPESSDKASACRDAILALLADGQRHHVTDLRSLEYPSAVIDATLAQLTEDEQLRCDGCWIQLP
ncbi:MAG: RecQ family ATP-dependent DNA helicase [Prevotella sp.]|nr:RecQ family ATP-dependent DNA helicase [Prevotella sp.]